MKIDVRHIGEYKEIKISYGGTTIETGLLGDNEFEDMAVIFLSAAEDLLEGSDEADAICSIRESL